MNEIYPRWVDAHGVMIVTPVYWYQAPGGLKSMMDRLVCADGGNPDPTRAPPARIRSWPSRWNLRAGLTRDILPGVLLP